MNKFWKDWIEADELKRLAITRKLVESHSVLFAGEMYLHTATSLLNSWFSDLEKYIEEKKK